MANRLAVSAVGRYNLFIVTLLIFTDIVSSFALMVLTLPKTKLNWTTNILHLFLCFIPLALCFCDTANPNILHKNVLIDQ